MKTAALHGRIEPKIKQQAKKILEPVGLSPTEAIRMPINKSRSLALSRDAAWRRYRID
jgi:antitoxin component of RelBE/YafQ-DinJ toxin-antitoxin module